MTNYPKISIRYNNYLDTAFKAWVKSNPVYKSHKTPSKRVVINHVHMYQKVWATYGPKILKAMCKATGMNFCRTYIPIYVVSDCGHSYADPIVLHGDATKKEFLNVITHELIHSLYVDNGMPIKSTYKLFPHEYENTSRHIPVYALLEYIFKDVLKEPSLFKNRIRNTKRNIPYKAAIKIAHKDYKNIIKTIKQDVKDNRDTINVIYK